MATKTWLGGAQKVPQANTITPASVGVGNTFTVTINGKTVSFVATAATVANVTAGLTAVLQASTEPEFTELTYADNTTNILVTGPSDGTPFTQTSSATGGTAANVTATATAGSGPNYWSVAANWSGGLPAAGDDVVIDNSAVSILYGLGTTADLFNSVTIGAGFTGFIGLPERSANGYAEYRTTHLTLQGCPVTVGQGIGQGSSRLMIAATTVGITLVVYATGTPADTAAVALHVKTTATGGATATVLGGSVGLATLPGTSGQFVTVNVEAGQNLSAVVYGGTALTLSTVNVDNAEAHLLNAPTTLTQIGADARTYVGGSATLTTLNADGGRVFWESSGTITAATTRNSGVLDGSTSTLAFTITNLTVNAGGGFLDPFKRVTHTNPFRVNCSLDRVDLDLGSNFTLARG